MRYIFKYFIYQGNICYETQFEMVDLSNYETLKGDLSKNMSQTPIPWA